MRRSLSFSVAVLVAAIACTSTESSTGDPSPSADAGGDARRRDASREDEGDSPPEPGDASGAPTTPAPTRKTSLEASMGAVTRTLDRAQFGNDTEGGEKTIYLEAHLGGDPACPDETSPTPQNTLIVANVPRGKPGETFTLADGVAVTYFDFTGDQFSEGAPFRKATEATITIVEIDGDTSVEIEVDATFELGTVKGRAYATYCESLSG